MSIFMPFSFCATYCTLSSIKKPGSRCRLESVLTSGLGSPFCYCIFVWRKMMCPIRTVLLDFHPNLQKVSWAHFAVLFPFKEHFGTNRRTTHRVSDKSKGSEAMVEIIRHFKKNIHQLQVLLPCYFDDDI